MNTVALFLGQPNTSKIFYEFEAMISLCHVGPRIIVRVKRN